jgi:creatinine amidohydrolase
MMAKHTLASLTFDKAKEAFTRQDLFIVPVGSTEPHGNYTPMGDYRLAEKMAEALATATGAIAVPVLPFGHATYFQNCQGGIALSAETYAAVFSEIVTSLINDGARNILVLNGHGGNTGIIANQLRLIRARHDVIVPSVNIWTAFDDAVWDQVHPELGPKAKGHGTEPMGSLSAYLYPQDCVDNDNACPTDVSGPLGLRHKSMHQGQFENLNVELPIYVEDLSPDAKTNGRYVPFAAEKGEVLFQHVLDKLIRFVAAYYHSEQSPSMKGRNQ